MAFPHACPRRVRFGVFEADFAAGELRKHGVRVRLQQQPRLILRTLIERSGEVVTRSELRAALWATDTFVGFDHGLNNAVNRLREALGDTADNPKFIETIPRLGYRFIAAVEVPATSGRLGDAIVPNGRALEAVPSSLSAPPLSRRNAKVAPFAAVVLIAALLSGVDLGAFLSGRAAPTNDPKISSIAVLPMENLTGDPGQEYLADGLTDALITQLARTGSLRVISRTSAMHYKGARARVRDIGRDLNVEAVIEGTVARAGNRLRVSTRLVSAASERHLWADTYDRPFTDVLLLEEEVARAIAKEVGSEASSRPLRQGPAVRPVNREAYEAFLKGRYFLTRWSGEGFQKGKAYLERSIALDPTYAPAYIGLAQCYGDMAVAGRISVREAATRIDENLASACRLDDRDALAHALAGISRFLFRCDRAGAEREFSLALTLSPNDVGVLDFHSYFMLETGRADQAIAEKRRVLESDPLSTRTNAELGLYLVEAGRNDEAIQQLQKTLELDPQYVAAQARLANAYAKEGRYDQAIAQMRHAIALESTPRRTGILGDLYARAGRKREAREVIRQLTGMVGETNFSPALVARIYARLGQNQDALTWLQKVQSGQETWLSDSAFDSLRADRRFQTLEKQLRPQTSCF